MIISAAYQFQFMVLAINTTNGMALLTKYTATYNQGNAVLAVNIGNLCVVDASYGWQSVYKRNWLVIFW